MKTAHASGKGKRVTDSEGMPVDTPVQSVSL
jgi:hypothetical protein